MTNGGDKHHGPVGKKKATEAKKAKDPKAALKRKNMLPKALDAAKVQERHGQ